MKSWNKQVSLLRVTTLTAALMGVYGVAGAAPGTLDCEATCEETGLPFAAEDTSNSNTWVVKGSGEAANVILHGGSVEATGRKNRAVGATGGAQVTLHGVQVKAEITTGDSSHFGNHGVQAFGVGSHVEIDGGTIDTEGKYSNGIQAEERGTVTGSGVTITAKAGENYTFGAEAGGGGIVNLNNGSSIEVTGKMAAGVRAYTGHDDDGTLKDARGEAHLSATSVIANGEGAIGLMAGDTDGAHPGSAGTITYANGTVLAEGTAARVLYGSLLETTDATLESKSGHGVHVNGATVELTDTTVRAKKAGGGNGSLVAGIRAETGANVTVNGGSIETEGGAFTRGILALSDAHVDTFGTTITTKGDNSHAVHAIDGDASGPPQIHVSGGTISTVGRESYGLSAQNGGEISTEDGTQITTEGEWGFGAFAYKGGKLDINNSSITTNGETSAENTIGGVTVDVGNYGVLAKNKSTASVTNTTVTTKGEFAEGLRAENDGAEGNDPYSKSSITATDVVVNTAGDEAHGVTAYGSHYDGAAWQNGSTVDFTRGSITTSGLEAVGAVAFNGGLIKLANTTITTSGVGAHGAAATVDAEDGATTFSSFSSGVELNNVHINVLGENAAGLAVYNGDSAIAMKGGSINATGENSAGLQLVNDADIDLDGVPVYANGPSIRSYFGTDEGPAGVDGQFEQTVELKGSDFTLNNSQFVQVTRGVGGENGEITVNLINGTTAIGNVENYGADGKLGSSEHTHIKVDGTSSWVGVMMDNKTKVAQSGETITGDQAGSVTTPDGANVSFQNVSNIGGSVSSTLGSTLTFSGAPTNIVGGVFGMPNSSTTFNNDVHIQGQGTEQQGGAALNGVGSSFAFNGNTTIGGPVLGDGSRFSFSPIGLTSLGSLGLHNFSLPTLDLDAWLRDWRERMEQQRQQLLEDMAKFQAQLLAFDAETRQGLSRIDGGSVDNPIEIAGDVEATGGSTTGGNLNIGGELNSVAAFVAPGNSIGTITTNTLGTVAGSVFEFEVDANGQADLLVVRNGDANLEGAALRVDQYEGYRLDHDYTIIRTEAGNVVNTFDSAGLGETFEGTLVKLDPVKYGAKDVKVSLSVNNEAVDRTGLSANQNATLDGVLSVAGQNASADATLLMQPDARKDALNQLSGELHGSTQAALLQNSSLVSRTLSARMRGNLGAGMLPGAPTAQAGGAVAGSLPTSAAYPLWAQVVGNWNTLDSDGNAAKVKTNTAGVFIGGDVGVGSGWRVGGALGYTDGRVKVDDRNSRSDVGTFTAAVYGGNSWEQGNGKLNFLAGAAYSHHDIDTRRQVNVGGNQTLKADYHAHTTQLFTELGYAMPVGERSVVEPYVGLAWLSQKARGFTEEGGAAALSADSQKDDVTTFTLGLRGKTALNVGSNPAHLFAGLGWRHASGDVDPGRRVSFVQGGGAAFNVAGAPISKNAAVFDLGVEMSVGRNTAMGLGYSGQYGSDNTDHSGQLYLRARF